MQFTSCKYISNLQKIWIYILKLLFIICSLGSQGVLGTKQTNKNYMGIGQALGASKQGSPRGANFQGMLCCCASLSLLSFALCSDRLAIFNLFHWLASSLCFFPSPRPLQGVGGVENVYFIGWQNGEGMWGKPCWQRPMVHLVQYLVLVVICNMLWRKVQ